MLKLYLDLQSCIVIVMQIKLTFVFLVVGTGICKVDRSIITRKTTDKDGKILFHGNKFQKGT